MRDSQNLPTEVFLPSPPPSTGESGRQFAAVRARAYVVGLLAVIVICLVVSYSELVASRLGSLGVMLGSTHMPPAAIGMIIILILANCLVKKVSRPLGIRAAELGVIYFMLVCAALMSSFGLVAMLLPSLVGVNYFASPQDHAWRDTFYSHIPKWLVPWDPSGPEQQTVSVQFYEGLRAGDHIPWANWIVPSLAWLSFAFLLFFLMACLTTLFRRQWVEHEKLTFPLVQLPMEMVSDDTSASFFRSRAMWLGFTLPVIVHGLSGVAKALPSVPELPTYFALNALWPNAPLNEMLVTPLVLSFSIIGFAYFLPLDVSFSMWFFLLFFRFQDYIALYLGYHLDPTPLYTGTRFYQAYQSTGAFAAIAVLMFWLARPHLRLVKERVLGRSNGNSDSDEFMNYHTAFWGGLVAFLLLVLWLKAAGMSPFVGAFTIAAFVFVIMLVLTRCVSEVGLLLLQPVFTPLDMWAVAAPKAAMGAPGLTMTSFLNGVFMRDPHNIMPAFMDSMKGADMVNVKRRSMAVGVLLTVLVGAFAALMIQLWLIYKYGGLQLNSWFFQNNARMFFDESSAILNGQRPFDYRAPVWFSMGSLFTVFLYAMRARFWWWPFHPLGYAMGCSWPAILYWSSFLVAWLVKSALLRYGGAVTYRRFRPFFLGLILGEFSSAILWTVLNALFGLSSPRIAIS